MTELLKLKNDLLKGIVWEGIENWSARNAR